MNQWNARIFHVDTEPSDPGRGIDIGAAARELVSQLMAEPWGQLSPSVYETGRLVTLAPWLTGHARRMDFLVAAQRPDGGWGGPDGYGLVPTLSATEALLSTATRVDQGVSNGEVAGAARLGLLALGRWLSGPTQLSIPDTPAIEIIVPALVSSVNQHLDRLAGAADAGLSLPINGRLRVPAGMDGRLLAAIRSAVKAGDPVPSKLLHSLEVLGGVARGVRTVGPGPLGTVGASPAATAAWLGGGGPPALDGSAVGYLEAVVRRHGGPVPSVIPVTAFERAWVLNALIGAGIDAAVPREVLAGMAEHLGDSGTPGGVGLPPDADTTSAVLLALARLGDQRGLDSLWAYGTETHFVTWHGERTTSTSANAHVLAVFGDRIAREPATSRSYESAADKLARWLSDQQRPDGTWLDKWHASPYYATACCAIALHRYGGAGAVAAVTRAVDWVLDTQRPDGSWGRWAGTAEETAYAMQILLLTGPESDRSTRAAASGYACLLATYDQQEDPPLWHDKDLYVPKAIVRAEILAALHLARRRPAVVALANRS